MKLLLFFACWHSDNEHVLVNGGNIDICDLPTPPHHSSLHCKMAKLEHVQLKKTSEFSIEYSNRFLKPPVRYKLHREKISLSQTLNKSIDTYKRDIRHEIGLDTKPKTLLGILLFLDGPITSVHYGFMISTR